MRFEELKIGILALQGCVEPHANHLKAAGAKVVFVKTPNDLKNIDGLIIPGGESTTFLKLISLFSLKAPLQDCSRRIPFWGICAGAILMAKKVTHPEQESLKIMDFEIERNAYGRQLQSFECEIENTQVAFIRAPVIKTILDPKVEVLHTLGEKPVWIKEGIHQVCTFHPELSESRPSKFHTQFLELCLENKSNIHSIESQTEI